MNFSYTLVDKIEELLQTINYLKHQKPQEQQIQNQNNEDRPLMESIQEIKEKNSSYSSQRTSPGVSNVFTINKLQDQMEFIKKGVIDLMKQNQNCQCHQLGDFQNTKLGKNRGIVFVKSENTYDKNTDQSKIIQRSLKQDLQEAITSLNQQEQLLRSQYQEMTQILDSKYMLDSSQKRQKIQQFEQQKEELQNYLSSLKQVQELNKKLFDLEISFQEKLKLYKTKFGIKN